MIERFVLEPHRPDDLRIFVYGSNLSGRHGAGAALYARQYLGAVTGQGEGLTGKCYGIPTKDHRLQTLSLDRIQQYVNNFLDAARLRSDLEFYVSPIGTGLAGYSHAEIAPMFRNAPSNCWFPSEWKPYLT